jgi:hypothetical protein
MSKPGTGAAAVAAALGAWLATPVVAILSRGSLDERRAAAIRCEAVPVPVPAPVPAAPRQQARHADALRRARVREAQVRAAMAAVPAPRTGGDLPRRSPLPD